MKRWILLLVLVGMVLAGPLVLAQEETDDPQPLLVLIEFNPWATVIGSDSPSFALYDNGLVVYRQADGFYYSTMLEVPPDGDLLGQFGVGADYMALGEYYDTVAKTDQPSIGMHVWRDGALKTVWVYGDVRVDPEARAETPPAFLSVFDRVVEFADETATPWLPDQLEIMLWPYETSDAADWPSEWSSLSGESTIVRYADQYSVFIPSSFFDDYMALHEEADAVRLAGATWAFALRFPFPAESQWLNTGETEQSYTPESVVATWQVWGSQALSAGDWLLSYEVGPDVRLSWSNPALNGVAFASVFLTDTPMSLEDADALITEDWLNNVTVGYEAYRVRHRCLMDDILLVEMQALYDGEDYLFGYWVWTDLVSFNTFSLVLPVSQGPEWKRIATTLMGDAALCPVG